jgi:hypothetical protein
MYPFSFFYPLHILYIFLFSFDSLIHFRFGSRGRAKSVGPSDHKKIPAESNEIGCCRKCSSRVFEAEKMTAKCGWFHKDCFKCFNCNHLLDVTNYQDGRKDGIFCRTCHKAIEEEIKINSLDIYAKAVTETSVICHSDTG